LVGYSNYKFNGTTNQSHYYYRYPDNSKVIRKQSHGRNSVLMADLVQIREKWKRKEKKEEKEKIKKR